jgi:decaprenylphospho-beta-D-ribofuranose 2-oxidase
LRETFDVMEQNFNAEYSVCWLDTSAQKHNVGRGLIYLGKHSIDENMNIKSIKQININKKFIPKLCNNYLFKILNFLFYSKNLFKIKKEKIYFDDYFYPLDKIYNWNYFYGSKGFLQYQFCIPLNNSYDGILEVLKEIQKTNNVSFTSVLKLMGNQNLNTLSFPFKGYTLALDFPRSKNIFKLLDRLDQIVIKYNGKVYLTKDSRLKRDSFIKMYKNYKIFTEFRKNYNLLDKIKSNQSQRLEI